MSGVVSGIVPHLDALHLMCAIVRGDGRILRCNNAFSRRFGAEARSWTGRLWPTTLWPSSRSGKQQHWLDRVGAGRLPTWSNDTLRADTGDEIPVTVSFIPLHEEDRALQAVLALCADQAAAAPVAPRPADASRRGEAEIITRQAGHDLRNLLHVMLGHCDLILQEPTKTGDVVRSAQIVTQAVERAQSLVTQVMGRDRDGPNCFQPVNLVEALDQVVALIAPMVPAGVTVSQTGPADALPVRGAPAQLERAFLNLLLNAFDAAGANGRVVIHREVLDRNRRALAPGHQSEARAWARVRIVDNGPGVPHGLRGRIFRSGVSTKADRRGAGLGLAIVRRIIGEHGGEVAVWNDAGGGAEFRVLLPIGR